MGRLKLHRLCLRIYEVTYSLSLSSTYLHNSVSLIASDQGWDLEADLVYQCVSESEAYTMVQDGTAVMAVGRFVVNSDAISSGFTFSQPYYSSGLKLVGRKVYERDAWSFLYPITIEVGMAFIVMTILVAFALWLFEEQGVKRPFMHHVLNFNEVFYDSLASYFYTNAIELKRLASKLLQWMFWFVLFVFLSLYQADLTAIYSNNYFRSTFQLQNRPSYHINREFPYSRRWYQLRLQNRSPFSLSSMTLRRISI